MSHTPSIDIARSPPASWGKSGLPTAWSSAGEGVVASLINVRPLVGGWWCVHGEDLEPLVFARGGHAERQARSLARGFARLGRDARVNVYDARDRLAGCISYFGDTSPPIPGDPSRYPWSH